MFPDKLSQRSSRDDDGSMSSDTKKEKNLSEEDWERFFALLGKIVNQGGSYQEKRDEVRKKAEVHAATEDFEEFVSWFPEEV